MHRLYIYFWALAMLLVYTARAKRTYYIDSTCLGHVQKGITEAIEDLLPNASKKRDSADLAQVLALIYPGITTDQKNTLFSESALP